MQQKIGKSGCFAWIVAVSFATGGVMTLLDFIAALFDGPDTTTRLIVPADEADMLIALILIVGTVGLVGLTYRYPELRAQVGLRFIVAWTLMLTGGVLNNLLPTLFDMSYHTHTLLTAPLYGVGALVFVWWLVWPPRFLLTAEDTPDTPDEV